MLIPVGKKHERHFDQIDPGKPICNPVPDKADDKWNPRDFPIVTQQPYRWRNKKNPDPPEDYVVRQTEVRERDQDHGIQNPVKFATGIMRRDPQRGY